MLVQVGVLLFAVAASFATNLVMTRYSLRSPPLSLSVCLSVSLCLLALPLPHSILVFYVPEIPWLGLVLAVTVFSIAVIISILVSCMTSCSLVRSPAVLFLFCSAFVSIHHACRFRVFACDGDFRC